MMLYLVMQFITNMWCCITRTTDVPAVQGDVYRVVHIVIPDSVEYEYHYTFEDFYPTKEN